MRFRVARLLLFAPWLLCCGAVRGQSPVWTQFPDSPGGTTRHDDIYMLDEATGWTARGRGGIFKTSDGGQTWVQKLSQSSTHFRCIGFASATRGWAGNLGPGSYDSLVTDTNVLYETFDGGETWTNRPGFAEAGMKGLCSLHVLDSQSIYGVGRVRGPAYFIKSTDGGANWTITNLTAAGVMGAMMDVYFKDRTNGFVVGMSTNAYSSACASIYHGRIARTTNGGATWFPVATTTVECCYFWKMSWPTPDVGYVSLQQNGAMSSHIFYKTTDGGATWVSNGVPFSVIGIPAFYWQGIGFMTENEGWAGGSGTTSPYANNFLHTTDGGASWTPVGYNASQSINRIRVLSPTLAFASGAKLHVFRVPLSITNQPQGQWVSPGDNVTFDVGVYGNPPFAYQWKQNGTNLAGATNPSLAVSNVVRGDSGTYAVVVTNASGNLTSSNAELRVASPQVLTGPYPTSADQVSISFSDAPGGVMNSNYIPWFQVQASTNLLDWESLDTTLSITNGKLLFHDSAAHPRRFYRVLEH